ncbi:MAG TPA: DUF305 domain-containing protein [Sphingobacteriaceae bacterium]
MGNQYRTFFIMLLTSFVIMYAVMFLNVDKLDHVYLSTTRTYMSLLMVSPMALLMLVMMPGMYKDKKKNTMIIVSSIIIFVLALTFLRKQVLITDQQYMKAMIPHHSSAILVSQEAKLTDPELKKLAEEIIKSQEEEIAQMKAILQRLENE